MTRVQSSLSHSVHNCILAEVVPFANELIVIHCHLSIDLIGLAMPRVYCGLHGTATGRQRTQTACMQSLYLDLHV